MALDEGIIDRDIDRTGLVRGLGLLSSTMIVAGSMIGSGIFIVSSDIARQLGSPGWLLVVWVLTGLLTLAAALSYGELAAMMPRAGGQYAYLREAFGPLSAFLYGWALLLVIQTGTIAAVAIAFARFLGVLWPAIGPEHLLLDFGLLEIAGIGFLSLSLSTQQLTAIGVVVLLTASNLTGLHTGRWIQDIFTIAKVGALLGLIALGLFVGRQPEAAIASAGFWTPVHAGEIVSIPALAPLLATAMVGALFAADAWNNITFTAGEVKDPERNIPLSMALGVGLVTLLYVLANVVYLSALPMEAIQSAPQDRVGVVAAEAILGANAELIMAIAIMVSCFGCNNGMILAGARVYYSMARDGLLFKPIGRLNRFRVPGVALLLQALWTIVLTLPRTYDPATGAYGNLYGNLLDYIIFTVLVFYIATIAGLMVLRRTRPHAARPYRAFGYPWLPTAYIVVAGFICVVLLMAEKTRFNAVTGLALVLTGLPAYYLWQRLRRP